MAAVALVSSVLRAEPTVSDVSSNAAPRKTILVVGDSLAAGYGIDPAEAFPALLQQEIDTAGLQYKVINAGLSGDTSAGGLRRINWLLKQRVDVLVLELGGNDGLRGIQPESSKANLQGIIDRTRRKYPEAKVVIAGMQMPPNWGPEYVEQFQRIYPALAKENHAALVPFLLEGVGGRRELNQADRIHPTPEGQRILAENVWRVMRPLLREDKAAAPPPKPNIVMFVIDDLGWADLGCYGSTFYRTPQIDRLATQGMRFTDAYAAGPVCSPTRASILTGKYPARLELTDWLPGRQDRPSQKLLKPEIRRHLPLEEITIAEALKPAGYISASIGKWHLGGMRFLPQDQGFDLNIAGDETGSPISYFAPFRSGRRVMAGLEQSPAGEYLTDRLTDEAENFIQANRERPFFLYFAHYAVHIPLKAKEELVRKYLALETHGPQTNAIYAAMIESVDQSVGRILRKLDDLNLAQRTIVLFTSDNGGLSVREGPNTPATSNAPLRGGKGYLYEGGIRVPLLVRWPGVVREGGVEGTPVSTVDFLPTLLAAVGVTPPAPLDGVSLLPLVQRSGAPGRDALFWHYPHYSNQGGKPCGAIRDGDFKLIEFFEDNHLELYNLKEDLGERKNLASALPDKAVALKAKLTAWRLEQKAQMMEPNPDYDPTIGRDK